MVRPRSKSQRNEHLRVLERALINGVPVEELAEAACSQFGLKASQFKFDLKALFRRLTAEGERIQRGACEPAAPMIAVLRRERIYKDAIKNDDRRIALEAEKDRCRLIGVYPLQRDDSPTGNEEQDLDRAIEQELQRLARGRAPTTAEETADAGYPRLADDLAD